MMQVPSFSRLEIRRRSVSPSNLLLKVSSGKHIEEEEEEEKAEEVEDAEVGELEKRR